MSAPPDEPLSALIDRLLAAAGWQLQDPLAYDPVAARCIALRDPGLRAGALSYVLMIDQAAVGLIEAERQGVAEQSGFYGDGPRAPMPYLRFFYELRGRIVLFRDIADPLPRPRPVSAFHRPETLAAWLSEVDTLRGRLRELPPLDAGTAAEPARRVEELESAFVADKSRTWLTGRAARDAARLAIVRLLRNAGARRVLYLIDDPEAGKQLAAALERWPGGMPGSIQIGGDGIEPGSTLVIARVDELHRKLRGATTAADDDTPMGYNPAMPIETFDFVFADDATEATARRQAVLDYFDAFRVRVETPPGAVPPGGSNHSGTGDA